jgi:hypothetical protein
MTSYMNPSGPVRAMRAIVDADSLAGRPADTKSDPAAPERAALAEAVRRRCLEAALEAYESAGMSGLCAEGRWEAAVDAMRRLDLRALVAPPERGA